MIGETLIYVIIAVVIYTGILALGYYRAIKLYKARKAHTEALQALVKEILNWLTKEEEKPLGNYFKNKLNLTELLTTKPKEQHYEEILDLLADLARDTYEDYKFLIVRSKDETKDTNFLQIQSSFHECPEVHKSIFSKAIDYGIDMATLQKKFAKKFAKGEVIDLGDNVVVITDDGTGQLPTGVSPINSGLEGGEITFIISFIKKDNYEKWAENNLPKEDEDK